MQRIRPTIGQSRSAWRLSPATLLALFRLIELLFWALIFLDQVRMREVKKKRDDQKWELMRYVKHILVSKGTTLTDIVEKENCGLAVDCNSVNWNGSVHRVP